ncbi:MAG: hypothetical protein OSB83_11100 [Planctomycetota bacterium]|jgi:hypothetical protein|nr:hypothetical protein [Planctomycetota bacterium]|tara:strand:- start:138 stop:647 length:510 start_codon:yes stop_codon:yes gene_type:complete
MSEKKSGRTPGSLLVALLAGGTRKNTIRVLGVLAVLLIVGGAVVAAGDDPGVGILGLGGAIFGGFLLIGIPLTNFGKWDGFNSNYKPPKRKIKETPLLNRLSLAVRVTGSLCLLLGTGGCALDFSVDVGNLGPTPVGAVLVAAGLLIWFAWFFTAGVNRDWLRGESGGP